PPQAASAPRQQALARPARWIMLLAAALCIAILAALVVGRDPTGAWTVSTGAALQDLLPWRWPRVLASVAAGGMLAMAGVILQRYTGNPMASPEVLGVSSGAGLGLVASLFLAAALGDALQTLCAAGGAGLTMGVLLWLSRTAHRNPTQFLLIGVALTAFLATLFAVLMASGDPRMLQLLPWMSGSTHGVLPAEAVLALILAVCFLLIAPLTGRWLEILPLGSEAARALGVDLRLSRLCLLVLATLMTAAATLLVGPLTFVGLMAPHLARQVGFVRPRPQLLASALLAALMMLAADWLGRTIDFPWQFPAGLIATLLASPFLLWLLSRRPA
ncbi:iron chelate uptake ABC transporter family permease subunit, partial [Nitratireductor sp. ZSWI3]|uniref:iron chelate uptake ABC transporter family permease subunit n=1 Tax=Nitratireductor sp. ZSWI3 TaxID=2966359 RepID=UPI0021506A35